MGTVYRAQDQVLGREVAVKVLHAQGPGQDTTEAGADLLRLLQEARAAAQLVHPGIVPVHRVGVGPHGGFVEMAKIGGPSMREVLRGPLPPLPWRALCLAQLACALQAAHDRGVVHCDVKPDNVLLRTAGWDQPPQPVLVDFGLARTDLDGTRELPLSRGTTAYLAPENADGPPQPASDQFALSVLAAEWLCGELPQRPSWHNPLTPPAGLPRPVREVLGKAGALEPAGRYANVTAFADALLRAMGMPELRATLVGAPVAHQVELTSALVPVPLAALALGAVAADAVLCALVAVLPAGLEGAVQEAWGGPLPTGLVTGLLAAGRLRGDANLLELGNPDDRDAILYALPGRVLRHIQACAARAVEQLAARHESARQDAVRLWVGARQPAEAARLATESAWSSRSARVRAQHLARAASWLANPAQPLPWLMACVTHVDWLLRCGMVQEARPALAEAQGLLVDAYLPANHVCGQVLMRHVAEMAWLSGRGHTVQAHLVRAAAVTPAGSAAAARLLALAHRSGLHELAFAAGNSPIDASDVFLLPLAAAQAEALTARALLVLEGQEVTRAERLAQQALDLAREAADPLTVALALLALGRCALARSLAHSAERLLHEAADVAAPLGPTLLSAHLDIYLAQALQMLGKPWPALRCLLQARIALEVLDVEQARTATGLQIDQLADQLGGDAARQALTQRSLSLVHGHSGA
jgi:tetratricopeptide (TPR) repeat protein